MTSVQRGTLVATGLGLFMIFLDALIVNVALPDIQASFGVGESGLQWIVTAYSIGMAVFMMTAASIADRWGRRRLYVVSVLVFITASAVSGLAPSIGVLNVSRAVQGVAAAAVNVTSLALVSASFTDPDRRARAIGIWTAIAATGVAIGPTVGGLLTQWVGWRSVFFVNIPVGIIAVLLAFRFVAESANPEKRGADPVGQVLYIVAVGAFAYAIIEGPQLGWTSARILTGLGLFVVALAGFIRWELREREPMMDLRLFANRTYTLAIVTIFMTLFGGYGMMLLLTQFWQNVRGFSALFTGLLILPFALTQMFFSPRIGALVAKVGSRRLILTGLALSCVGYVTQVVGVGLNRGLAVAGIFVVGAGVAFTMTPSTTVAMSTVSDDRAGMASGIMSSQRAIGSTAGYAVLGSILAAYLGATLNSSLANAIPDASQRDAVTDQIIDEADPRAYAAEIGPGRPIPSASTATEDEIRSAAEDDFRRGIQLALGTAAVLVLGVLVAGWFGYPHDAPDRTESRSESEASPRAPPAHS